MEGIMLEVRKMNLEIYRRMVRLKWKKMVSKKRKMVEEDGK